MASTRFISILRAAAAASLALGFATPTAAETGGFLAIPDIPDIEERVSAFRQALREITVEPLPPPLVSTSATGDILSMESRFHFTDALERPGLDEHPGMPGRRDLVFEEQWLLAGREDEHQRAARHWLGRRLKGSDLRREDGDSLLRARFAWDHGPLVGIGHGSFSARVGESQWRLQWSKRWARSSGPWSARAWIGEDQGEFVAAFLIGRSLLDSYGR